MKNNLVFLVFLIFLSGFFPILFVNTKENQNTYVMEMEDREKQEKIFDDDNVIIEMGSVDLRIDSADFYTSNGDKALFLQRGIKYNLQVHFSNLSESTGFPYIVATFYDENLVPISTNSSIIKIMPHSQYSVCLGFTLKGHSYVGIGTLRINFLTKSVNEGGVTYGSEYVKTILITQ